MNKEIENTISYLKGKKKIVFVTTSNRWKESKEKTKSTLLAEKIKSTLEKSKCKVTIFDISKMKIYPCEGNVSSEKGNECGINFAELKDKTKNPSGNHRCWASINNPDDELWKISKELFESDCIVFFTSVRWGQTNQNYQKLIERLTWLENRHSTLGEKNIIGKINAGIIIIGHNWNVKNVLENQKKVLSFFGFKVNKNICWGWQYTKNSEEESNESYLKDSKKFKETFL